MTRVAKGQNISGNFQKCKIHKISPNSRVSGNLPEFFFLFAM